MELVYTLEKGDFLNYQLFHASQSKRVRNKRKKGWLIVPIVYVILGFLMFLLQGIHYLVIFSVIAVFWLAAYPFYSRWLYKRQYVKLVNEQYGYRVNKKISLSMNDTDLLHKDDGGDGRIHLSEIDHIYVISTNAFIHLKSGTSFIIPKLRTDPNKLDAFLKQLEQQTGITREVLDWKWK